MNTRLFEKKDFFRASVRSVELLQSGRGWLLFRTAAPLEAPQGAAAAAGIEKLRRNGLNVGAEIEGRLRLDFLADHVLRVRYAEGQTVPSNPTPMVVGAFPGPRNFRIDRRPPKRRLEFDKAPWLKAAGEDRGDGRCLAIRTRTLLVNVFLKPYRLEIRERQTGRAIAGVGGPEKDSFCCGDTLNTGLTRHPEANVVLAVENFDLSADECIYGLGEKFGRLNKVGQTVDLDMRDALGVTTPRSYKNVPFYVSTAGYGVFFNHSSRMTYWVGSASAADVQVAAEDDFLDYYLFCGDIRAVLADYTRLTGRGVAPPDWTFGFWQSKMSYVSAAETLEIARELRRRRVPCDVIHLDTHWFKADWYCDLEFDRERFPDPKAYFEELARLGFKVSLWQLPYIPEGCALFEALKAVDGFVKTAGGEIYNIGLCPAPGFKGVVGVIDYTNPRAVRVHQDALRRLFRLGARVIKTDFGEAAPADGVYHDGTPGHRMHNLYPLLYNRAVFEVTKEETGAGVVWGRSAWAGSQRYPLHWGGDSSPNAFNLFPQIWGGLSFGLSGFQFWSQDIGGFCGDTHDELLIRWLQASMFMSHARIHGSGDRELYKFKPATLAICRAYLRLRYRLLPYILGSARRCVEQSLPMLRALVIEYQDDPATWNLDNQFLFGESLLVAPMLPGQTARRVYLPRGVWTDWWTGRRCDGGRCLSVKAGLRKLPLFIREGALIPLGPALNFVGERPVRRLELLVSLFEHGAGSSSFAVPVNGAIVPLAYRAAAGRHTLTIGPTDVEVVVRTLGPGKLRIVRQNPLS